MFEEIIYRAIFIQTHSLTHTHRDKKSHSRTYTDNHTNANITTKIQVTNTHHTDKLKLLLSSKPVIQGL